MNKKSLRTLGITLSLTMFLLGLGLCTINNEDPPLLGENIIIAHHIC